MSDNKYALMSLLELKAELKARNNQTRGKKKQLVDRLVALDCLNVQLDPADPEYNMQLPDSTLYRDITTDSAVPEISMQNIEKYFVSNGKLFEKKYKNLYTEKFIRFVRMSESADGNIFFNGVVWAEMRKSVAYQVDIRCTKDAVIEEAQCECGAGQGPGAHCKHVGAVLYGLHCVATTGSILFEQTCTQKLQSFHKAKTYRGSPKKVAALRENELTYDPRPKLYQESATYAHHFRNSVLQYTGPGGDMPVLQLYRPANLYGVIKDHTYAGAADVELIKSLQLEEVTDEYVQSVEAETRGQASSDAWHNHRTTHLTSSHFGDIVKATERRDRKKQVDLLLNPQHFTTRATSHGIKHEDSAKKCYRERYDVDITESGLVISKTHPYLAASPDGLVSEDVVLEVKCPFTLKDCMITPNTVPFLCETGLKTNHNYYYQVQGQLFCTGRKVAYFCVYTFKDFKVFIVERDDIFIANMVESLETFYQEHYKPALIEKHIYKNYGKYFF